MSEWKKRLDRKIEIFAGAGIGRVGRPGRRARRAGWSASSRVSKPAFETGSSMRSVADGKENATGGETEPLLDWMNRQYAFSAAAMLRAVSATDLVKERRGFGQTIRPSPGSVLASPRWLGSRRFSRRLTISTASARRLARPRWDAILTMSITAAAHGPHFKRQPGVISGHAWGAPGSAWGDLVRDATYGGPVRCSA